MPFILLVVPQSHLQVHKCHSTMYQLKKIYVPKKSLKTCGSGKCRHSEQGCLRTPISSRPPGATEQVPPSERQDGLVNDFHRLLDLILLDHQRRSKPDDVAMGGLSQKPIISKPQTHLPSIIIFGFSNNNCV